jgi:CheY-like chemotaxis protein
MSAENNTVAKGIVLIIDDAPGNLAVLSDMLSEADYRVLVATDGLSALEQIECLKPDIILLDIMMPGIDGFETCHRLKNNQSTAHIPIIFMTGLSELEDLLKGFGEGAVDYIVKPIKLLSTKFSSKLSPKNLLTTTNCRHPFGESHWI